MQINSCRLLGCAALALIVTTVGCGGDEDPIIPDDNQDPGFVSLVGQIAIPGVNVQGWEIVSGAGGRTQIDPTGGFRHTVPTDKPTLLFCADGEGNLLYITFANPTVAAGKAAPVTIDVTSAVIASILISPGLYSSDKQEHQDRVGILVALPEFSALVAIANDAPAGQLWTQLVHNEEYAGQAGIVVEAMIAAMNAGSVASGAKTVRKRFSLESVGSISAIGQARIRLEHDGFKWVSLFREDFDYKGQRIGLHHIDGSPDDAGVLGPFVDSLPGGEPLSWGSLFALIGGSGPLSPTELVDSFEKSFESGYSDSHYWIVGPGLLDPEGTLPMGVEHTFGEAELLTTMQYIVLPALDTVLGSIGAGGSTSVLYQMPATLMASLQAGYEFSSLIQAWDTGDRSGIVESSVEFMVHAIEIVAEAGDGLAAGETIFGLTGNVWQNAGSALSMVQAMFGAFNLGYYIGDMATTQFAEVEDYTDGLAFVAILTADTSIYERSPSWTLRAPSGRELVGISDKRYLVSLFESGEYLLSPSSLDGYDTPLPVAFVVDNNHGIVEVPIVYGAADVTAPDAVVLVAGSPTSSSVTLTWSAPGDDGAVGTATEYDVRYSTASITVANWDAAIQAGGEPEPQAAGTPQSLEVAGLAPNATYYFALATRDEVANWSAISNVATLSTLAGDPGVSPGFKLIESGEFYMGSPTSEAGHQVNEDLHHVTFNQDFEIQETEVTNQQYVAMAQWALERSYCSATSARITDSSDATIVLLDMANVDCEISYSNRNFTIDTGKADYPVQGVTWYGAAVYCDWLSRFNGLTPAYDHATWQCGGGNPYSAAGYRLPTEAEWEFACRAGRSTPFNTGVCLSANTEANYLGTAPYSGCSAGPNVGETRAVRSYLATPNNLFEMHGNALEWCNDWYNGSYGSAAVSNPLGPSSGSTRVRRGGFWGYEALRCRSAHRHFGFPDSADSGVGFRPVRTID